MFSVICETSMTLCRLAGRLSLSSICPSTRLMYANESGAVRVVFRMPTTVNVWFTKSGLAPAGVTGRSIVSPICLLNSLSIVEQDDLAGGAGQVMPLGRRRTQVAPVVLGRV